MNLEPSIVQACLANADLIFDCFTETDSCFRTIGSGSSILHRCEGALALCHFYPPPSKTGCSEINTMHIEFECIPGESSQVEVFRERQVSHDMSLSSWH